jgi:hypothetical protein
MTAVQLPAGGAEAAERLPVVRALGGDHFRPARAHPGQLEGAFHGFRAAGTEEGILKPTRQNLRQQLRQVRLKLVEENRNGQRLPVELFPNRGHHRRVAVPQTEHAQATQEIQPLVPLHVPEVHSIRRVADRAEPHELEQVGEAGVQVPLVLLGNGVEKTFQLIRRHAFWYPARKAARCTGCGRGPPASRRTGCGPVGQVRNPREKRRTFEGAHQSANRSTSDRQRQPSSPTARWPPPAEKCEQIRRLTCLIGVAIIRPLPLAGQ